MFVKNFEKKKLFSLYVNDSPVLLDKTPINYDENTTLRLGETVPGKEITWMVFTFSDDSTVWYCDRNLINYISKDDINKMNLASHDLVIENFAATLTLPILGFDEKDVCEWTDIMNFLDGDEENLMHWLHCFSIGKEMIDNAISVRGNVDAYGYYRHNRRTRHHSFGWRPVLRNVRCTDSEFMNLWNQFLAEEAKNDTEAADAALWKVAEFLKTKIK